MAIVELNKGQNFMCFWGGIVVDILSLGCLLINCKFMHVRREVNILTHNLIKWVKNNGKDTIYG